MMEVCVKNGCILKKQFCQEGNYNLEWAEEQKTKINGMIRDKINGQRAGMFRLVCLQTTVQARYAGKPDENMEIPPSGSSADRESGNSREDDISMLKGCSLEELIFRTNVSLSKHMNYAFSENTDEYGRIAEHIGSLIMQEVMDAEFSASIGLDNFPEMEKIRETFKSLCGMDYEIACGKHKPVHNSALLIYFENCNSLIPSYGNKNLRFQYDGDGICSIDGEYGEACRFLRTCSYEKTIKPYMDLQKKWDGKFEAKNGKLALRTSIVVLDGINNAMELSKQGEDIGEYMLGCDRQISDYAEEKEKERTAKEEKKKKKGEEIREAPICRDIYSVVLQSGPISINSIVQHLKGTKTTQYIGAKSLYGKWSHVPNARLKDFVTSMAEQGMFESDLMDGPYGPFVVLSVGREIAWENESGEKGGISAELSSRVSELAHAASAGQSAMKELCSIFTEGDNADLRQLIAMRLKKENYNPGFVSNPAFVELLGMFDAV